MVAKKRIGQSNFITAIRETLKNHYGQKVVGRFPVYFIGYWYDEFKSSSSVANMYSCQSSCLSLNIVGTNISKGTGGHC